MTVPIPALQAFRIGATDERTVDHLNIASVFELHNQPGPAPGIMRGHPLGFDQMASVKIGMPGGGVDDHVGLAANLLERPGKKTENALGAMAIGRESSPEQQVESRTSQALRIGHIPPSQAWPNTLWDPEVMKKLPAWRIGEAPPEVQACAMDLRPFYEKMRLGGPEQSLDLPLGNDIGRMTWDWLEMVSFAVHPNIGFPGGVGHSLGLPKHSMGDIEPDQASKRTAFDSAFGAPAPGQGTVDVHAHLSGTSLSDMETSADTMVGEMDDRNIGTTFIAEYPQSHESVASFGGNYQSLSDLISVVNSRASGRAKLIGGGHRLSAMMVEAETNPLYPRWYGAMFEFMARYIANRTDVVAFGEIPLLHLSGDTGVAGNAWDGHPYIRISPDNPLLLQLVDIASEVGLPIDVHMDIVLWDVDLDADNWGQLVSSEESLNAPNPNTLEANLVAFRQLLRYADSQGVKIIWDHLGFSMSMEGLINDGGTYSYFRSLPIYPHPFSPGPTYMGVVLSIPVDEHFLPELLHEMLLEYDNLYLSISDNGTTLDNLYYYSGYRGNGLSFPHDMGWDTNEGIFAAAGLDSRWTDLFWEHDDRFVLGSDQFFVQGFPVLQHMAGTWRNFRRHLWLATGRSNYLGRCFDTLNVSRIYPS